MLSRNIFLVISLIYDTPKIYNPKDFYYLSFENMRQFYFQ